VIKDAAHHLDIRSSNPEDPPAVVAARRREKMAVKRWLRQYWNQPLPRSSTTEQVSDSHCLGWYCILTAFPMWHNSAAARW